MSKVSPTEIVSYAGGSASIVSALTLTDVGVIVGIVTALLTFIFNLFYMRRKEKREMIESAERMRHEKEAMQVWLANLGVKTSDKPHMPVQK